MENVDCKCNKKWTKKIPEASRKRLFEMFWNLESFSSQYIYVCWLVSQSTPVTRRPRDSSREKKSTTNHYRFQVEGNSVRVCKSWFLKTLQISDGQLTRALKKIETGEQPGSDNKGHHVPGNKLEEVRMSVVRDHISSFPLYSPITQDHKIPTENIFLPT